MRFFNSIRWRLQIWYGLILVVVLAGFGFTAYQLERGRLIGRIDDDLRRRINALNQALRPQPRDRGPQDGQPSDGPPRGPQERGPGQPFQPFDGGRPDNFQQPPREFRLTPQAANLFDETDTNGFYFVLWARDGNVMSRSANAPAQASLIPPKRSPAEKELANPPNQPPGQRLSPPEPQAPRERGEFREMNIFTPPGEIILVGRSIAPEFGELRFSAIRLAGVGGIILLFGLAGGWWLASRAIRPIEDISATAVKISAGDLSQRISVADRESELGRLASVLNSTFARLDASFAQQKQFTSDAAHELRTPVSVMLTQTQMTLNRERGAHEYRDTVESCQRAAQRMRRLIESLLELARLDAGQEQMRRMQFDLSATARDCMELIRPLADERGVKIFSDLSPLDCTGDSERLAQVITNLLTNAIQYNKPDGEVRIAVQSQGDMAVLIVSDTGVGISAEDLPYVFERFYRADKARSGASGHAGLGLSISKAIVEAHGGTIDVTSEPGAGANFFVRLPLVTSS
jgi:signal transduction histidine kinase